MADSAKVIHDTIYVKGADALDILSKTSEFYDSAWDKLIFVLTASFAVLGILVPIGIQWYQRRVLRIEKKELETSIVTLFNARIEAETIDLNERIKEETKMIKETFDVIIADEVKKLNKKFDKLEIKAISMGLFVQGNANRKFKEYDLALVSYVQAIKGLAMCGDWYNFDRIVKAIEITIPHIHGDTIEDLLKANRVNFSQNFAKVQELCDEERKKSVEKLIALYMEKQEQKNNE